MQKKITKANKAYFLLPFKNLKYTRCDKMHTAVMGHGQSRPWETDTQYSEDLEEAEKTPPAGRSHEEESSNLSCSRPPIGSSACTNVALMKASSSVACHCTGLLEVLPSASLHPLPL